MCESHWKASEQPNVCAFLKAVMMRVNPLLLVPQLSVWYLRVTKFVLVMMNPLLPTELRSLSQEMCACWIIFDFNLEKYFATYPPWSSHVSSIIDVEMVIAIHLESLELEQELLHNRLCLESNDTVFIPLISTLKNNSIHSPLDLG